MRSFRLMLQKRASNFAASMSCCGTGPKIGKLLLNQLEGFRATITVGPMRHEITAQCFMLSDPALLRLEVKRSW